MIMGKQEAFLRSLPICCQCYIDGALAGDADAALSLLYAAPNRHRGEVVKALWKHGVPTDTLRTLVEAGWDHDHDYMFQTFGRRIEKLFRAAQFPVSHLPTRLTVWRGGGGDWLNLAIGSSWTLDRDIACWFTINKRFTPSNPLVLRREISRRSVLAHVNTRDEDEIVIWRSGKVELDGAEASWLRHSMPPTVTVDDVANWTAGFHRVTDRRKLQDGQESNSTHLLPRVHKSAGS